MQKEEHHIKGNLTLIRLLFPFLKPYKLQLILVLLALPFVAGLSALQPYILKLAIDKITLPPEINKPNSVFWIYPVILGLCALIATGLEIWQNIQVQQVGQRFVAKIRETLFEHLQSFGIDFFEQNQTGKLLTRLTNDLEALSETIATGFFGAYDDLLKLIAMVGFMLFINWKLALAQVSLIPLLCLLFIVFQRNYRLYSGQARSHLGQLNSLLQESLWGILVIKIFGVSKDFAKRFDSVNQSYTNANNAFITIDSSFSAVVELFTICGVLLLLYCAGLLPKETTAGELVAFVSYSLLIFEPLQSISEKFSTFQSGFTSAERVSMLLSEKPKQSTQREISSPELKTLVNSEVAFRAVSFQYSPDAPFVLKDISFKLPESSSLGIVGRTGSGKSTLVKLLCRFYDPSQGEISIGGYSLQNFSPEDLRKHLLLIPQRSFLFSGTVRENLLLDKSLNQQDLIAICQKTGLWQILERWKEGFERNLSEGGVDLSAGQKQLISLTRALIQDPEILILDEATANIDPNSEAMISRATKEILHRGKTVIFIAHRMHLVKECDHILVFSDGKVIEQGNHQELMNNESSYYAKLCQLSDYYL